MTTATIIDQIESVDQQLETLNHQDLLMIASILSNSDAGTLGATLTAVATLPKTMQGMIIDSIFAKIKAKR